MNGNDLNNTSRTDWAALESMSDEDIDYSDIPPLTDEFFDRAVLRIPADKAKNLVRLAPDVKEWFESQEGNLINEVLRDYIATTSKQT